METLKPRNANPRNVKRTNRRIMLDILRDPDYADDVVFETTSRNRFQDWN